MIGSYLFLGKELFICICVLFHIYAASHASVYKKCISEDGRQGLCVAKRHCREANQHELLPCEGDYHCCPITTTVRSAPSPTERHGGILVSKDDRQPPREMEREWLNETPTSGDNRRSPTRPSSGQRPPIKPSIGNREEVYDQENRRQRPPQVNSEEIINRPRSPARPSTSAKPSSKPTIARGRNDTRRRNTAKPNRRRVQPEEEDPPKTPEVFAGPKVPACGVKPYQLFIAGGEESQQHEWPWMTAIFRRYPDSRRKTFLCGGSLINTRYVLTAAHCFVNNYVILPASSFIVRLGTHFLDTGEEYTVSNLIIHQNHSGSDFFNDIALVRLSSEVYITDKIAPICLPSPDMMSNDFVGVLATVAGWGDVTFRSGHTRVLQHVIVPVITDEECSAAYIRVRGAAFLAKGSDHIICAGLREGGKDACLGDSGGPLMVKMHDDSWIIIGIVSLGFKCAEPGYPGVYTRVTHYMSWINTHMKKY